MKKSRVMSVVKTSIRAGILSLGFGLLVVQPAAAYDPCHRAQQDVEEAWAALGRYLGNHCSGPAGCPWSPRLQFLIDQHESAVARRRAACN